MPEQEPNPSGAIAVAATPSLVVEDLALATTGGTTIVEGISFAVAPGEVVSLVGESGSGKTAVALALLGHARSGMTITSGRVSVDGLDLLALSPTELQKARGRVISYVPQDASTSLNPRQRAGRQLRESMTVHGISAREADQRAKDLTARVGLPERVHAAYPFELSGGQQQRLLIAMAMATRPAVVVLDEPTTGLDVTTQAKVLDLVADLARTEQIAFVYISHDLAVVEQISDRIAVMYAGRIIEQGPTATLVSTPLHPYTALLLDSVPRVRTKHHTVGIPGQMPAPGNWPDACRFSPRCPLADDRCRTDTPPTERRGESSADCWKPRELVLVDVLAPPRVERDERTPVLRVDELQLKYPGTPMVVKDVSFEIRDGECVALVGESGSGKSTTGRAIAGLMPIASGSVQLGRDTLEDRVEKRTRQQRRDIQLIFQNPDRSLNPSHTVAQILGRPLRLFGTEDGQDVAAQSGELLDRVHLTRRALTKLPHELSGGEKQRVAIARGLAAQPKLLICDEITSALDVSVQASVIRLLDELRAQGLAMLFITHSLGVVSALADRVLVMRSGEVCEEGPTREVLHRPLEAYTVSLLDAAPELSVSAGGARGPAAS
ncbi:ABC transporter ATP-binding protein [Microbacterium sp. X-17]|uniref:ABC transporter ATP-binding protein n=1 Tax=Microbacterium sp. X-17 TaxID=3144404 RepID=UPI0031F4FD2D